PDSLPLERILLLLAVPAQGPLLPRLLDPAPAALRGQGSVDALEDREHDLGVLRVNASRRGAPLFDEGDGVVGRAGPVRLRDGAQRLGVKQDAAPPSLPRMVAGVGLVADASIGCLTRPSASLSLLAIPSLAGARHGARMTTYRESRFAPPTGVSLPGGRYHA